MSNPNNFETNTHAPTSPNDNGAMLLRVEAAATGRGEAKSGEPAEATASGEVPVGPMKARATRLIADE